MSLRGLGKSPVQLRTTEWKLKNAPTDVYTTRSLIRSFRCQSKRDSASVRSSNHHAEAERPGRPRPAHCSIDPQRRWASDGRDKAQHLSNDSSRFAAVEQPTLCFPIELCGRSASTLFKALWSCGNEWEESCVVTSDKKLILNKSWARCSAYFVNDM